MACVPVGGCFSIPRELHLDEVLPAAGAFTSQAVFEMPVGTKGISFYVSYTPGAAGGFPVFRVEWGNNVDLLAFRALILNETSLVVAQPEGTVNVLQETLSGPVSVASTHYLFEFTVPAGALEVRLLAAEAGVVGTPGSIVISLTGAGGC